MVIQARRGQTQFGYVAYKVVNRRVTDPGATPGMSTKYKAVPYPIKGYRQNHFPGLFIRVSVG